MDPETISKMRTLRECGMSYRDVGSVYNMSADECRGILTGRWRATVEWQEILSRPDAEVMKFIVTRGEWPSLMRAASPFGRVEAFTATGLRDFEVPLRVWRKAKLVECRPAPS